MSPKKSLALLAPALLAGWLALSVRAASALEIGDAMPKSDATMKNVDGRELKLDSLAGAKGTLVLFTCNACPWVKAWEERTVALGNEYAKKGIGVVAVNANDPGVVKEDGFDVMQKRAKERGIEYPYVVDEGSHLAKAFGAERTPEAFLFDANGKLVYHGTIDDNAQNPGDVKERYLRDALRALVGGNKIAVAETKSLGCTIKLYK
jgi:peroxiredoxin